MQWGDDLCFKVRGKIFTTAVLSDGRFPRICFKCTPEKFNELLEVEGITPAPYVGRYKWVLLANSKVLATDELEPLIRHSYEMVAAGAPKKKSTKKPAKKAPGKKRGGKTAKH